MSTKIQWTDEVWNVVTGCTKVSEGCRHCYAERVLPRTKQPFDQIVLHRDRLDKPLHWKKPRRVFVNSLSDLFHEEIQFYFIQKVFTVMAQAEAHTFQILTKRPERMLKFMTQLYKEHGGDSLPPLDNVWLGVSVEDQATADQRIPILLQTPAAVRFISAEPLLGSVDLKAYLGNWCQGAPFKDSLGADHHHAVYGIDWAILGGESGPAARPCNLAWIRSLKDQCQAAKVSCFVKQLGGRWAHAMQAGNAVRGFNDPDRSAPHRYDKKGGDIEEWPEDLRVRDYPKASTYD